MISQDLPDEECEEGGWAWVLVPQQGEVMDEESVKGREEMSRRGERGAKS